MTRKKLIERINREGRRMSTVTMIFHQVVAEKAGLSGTDHKYLDLIMEKGKMTAGEIAEATGLTTGAVTGIIDRLEKKNFVKRVRDPGDRRKVSVVPQHAVAMKKLEPVFRLLVDGFDAFYKQFTVQELTVIEKYLRGSSEFFQRKSEELKKMKQDELQ